MQYHIFAMINSESNWRYISDQPTLPLAEDRCRQIGNAQTVLVIKGERIAVKKRERNSDKEVIYI